VLCWLATVDEAGRPNVSPKEIFTAHGDDHLLIAHLASPGSVRNLRARPEVCVSFVDVFVQKGFKR
jgi:predicted pyridoxine 5'-phosphate oxidase superfamily flavin-nucleotide-binding protein